MQHGDSSLFHTSNTDACCTAIFGGGRLRGHNDHLQRVFSKNDKMMTSQGLGDSSPTGDSLSLFLYSSGENIGENRDIDLGNVER